jgi:hypothetical protein
MPKLGYITASCFKQLMVEADIKKDQFGAGAMTLAYEIATERFGVELPDAYGAALDWGNEHEWEARERYSEKNMVLVNTPLFIEHPLHEMIGGTPDGLVGLDGIIEIKCPHNPVHHLRNYLEAAQYYDTYKAQCQGYLWITDRKWVDFVSFDPRWPESKQLAVHRFMRDEAYIEMLANRVVRFEKIVTDTVQQIEDYQFNS